MLNKGIVFNLLPNSTLILVNVNNNFLWIDIEMTILPCQFDN